tara:strand:- start:1054 stop:1530 length:477 start_codon:yes stop_codon:yes gene_type:complete
VLDSKVMHKRKYSSFLFLTILIFQCFFINKASADHLSIALNYKIAEKSSIIIEGYDRKFYFEEKEFPLFTMNIEANKGSKSQDINLGSIPHKYIGIFAYIDLNNDGQFSLDFKGDPAEPYGFSLNPDNDFEDISYEDIVFDMNLLNEPVKITLNLKID